MDFLAQQYPSVEETVANNASVLYRRKKHFLGNLRQLVDGTGYVIIGLIYLRDILMFLAALKAFFHYCILNPYPTPSPTITVSDSAKKRMRRFILISVFGINFLCVVKHIILGPAELDDGYLYGGLTVQFIGEKLPKSKLAVLLLDLLLFCVQLVYHSLMCCTDDSEVLKTTPLLISEDDTLCRLEIEADGYNGNVSLITVDLFQGIVDTMAYFEAGPTLLWEMQLMSGEEGQQRPNVLLSQLLA